jgi:hypothetical protein
MFVTFGWFKETETIEVEGRNLFSCIFAGSNTLRGKLNLQKITL